MPPVTEFLNSLPGYQSWKTEENPEQIRAILDDQVYLEPLITLLAAWGCRLYSIGDPQLGHPSNPREGTLAGYIASLHLPSPVRVALEVSIWG